VAANLHGAFAVDAAALHVAHRAPSQIVEQQPRHAWKRPRTKPNWPRWKSTSSLADCARTGPRPFRTTWTRCVWRPRERSGRRDRKASRQRSGAFSAGDCRLRDTIRQEALTYGRRGER
jgi:hypothetical protein